MKCAREITRPDHRNGCSVERAHGRRIAGPPFVDLRLVLVLPVRSETITLSPSLRSPLRISVYVSSSRPVAIVTRVGRPSRMTHTPGVGSSCELAEERPPGT